MLLQLANRIPASPLIGVKLVECDKLVVEPNGDIIVDIALFNLLGVLFILSALVRFFLVFVANLYEIKIKR